MIQQLASPIKKVVRIISLHESCMYYRYSRLIRGKMMIKIRTSGTIDYFSFVNKDHQIALNKAAGWSENKQEYGLYKPKIRHEKATHSSRNYKTE